MKRKYSVDILNGDGLEGLANDLGDIGPWIDRKCKELVTRLAEIGTDAAQFGFDIAIYDGINDVKVEPEERGRNTIAIVASGRAVLFIEYGSGVYLGYGHPEPNGYGPGTYPIPPGKGHWNNKNGWYLPKAVETATGIKHSVGNPPAMAMYNAQKELGQRIEEIVQEVFSD